MYSYYRQFKIDDTVNAYRDLQERVIQKIYEKGISYWKKLKTRDNGSKLLTQYLHEIEFFCGCVNNKIYSYNVLYKISGKQLFMIYKDFELFLKSNNRDEKYYFDFKLLSERLNNRN